MSLKFFCFSLHKKTGQFVLQKGKKTPILLSGKTGFGAKSNQVVQIMESRINTNLLMLKHSKTRQLTLILLLNSRQMIFGWGPPSTHTHTPLLCRWWEVALWLGLWEASPGQQLCWLHIPPECYPGPGARGVPWTDIPTAKKTKHMYLEAHQLKITQAYI